MNQSARIPRLVLGGWLNPQHSWFAGADADVVYVLMEVWQETDYVPHHAQKILTVFAVMRDFTRGLRAADHHVRYVTIDDGSNRQSVTESPAALVRHYGAERVGWQSLDEWRLDEQLRRWIEAQSLSTSEVDTEHFLTGRHELAAMFEGRKQWLMEWFYREMRRRLGMLLDGVRAPENGQWDLDRDNRKPWRGSPPESADARPVHDHRALREIIERSGVKSFDNLQTGALRQPLNRTEVLACLDVFVAQVLPHFGDFEDATSSGHQRLFHSLLSFPPSVKMLDPHEVIDRAKAVYRHGKVPLPAMEGFIRQILGWREYVRGIYWAQTPGYASCNVLNHDASLPPWLWSGKTQMRCLQPAIGQSLQAAHAHHIQRPTMTGNFVLLAGLAPDEVHRWYLGVYIDAFEWVELPNTVGTSRQADGDRIAIKPYVSSAAYLSRMSDYCKGCHHDGRQCVGERACPYNALYWDFFAHHSEVSGRNPWLSMMYRQLAKMEPEEHDALRKHVEEVCASLEAL